MGNDLNASVIAAELDERPRIGILTSGGDCPGLNAVIRGVTKSAYWLGYQVIGFRNGFEGLIDPIQCQQLTPEITSGILVEGGTILGSSSGGLFSGGPFWASAWLCTATASPGAPAGLIPLQVGSGAQGRAAGPRENPQN